MASKSSFLECRCIRHHCKMSNQVSLANRWWDLASQFAIHFAGVKLMNVWKGKGSGVWPSMVTHTRNLSSAFNPSKCTLTAVNTHLEQWAAPYFGARGAVGGSVPCSRVSPQSWYWRWREHLLFTPPTDNPCRTWESNRQPLGYKSNSLTIRPRLPNTREVMMP